MGYVDSFSLFFFVPFISSPYIAFLSLRRAREVLKKIGEKVLEHRDALAMELQRTCKGRASIPLVDWVLPSSSFLSSSTPSSSSSLSSSLSSSSSSSSSFSVPALLSNHSVFR